MMATEPTIEQMNVALAAFEGRKFYGRHTIDKYGGDTGNALPEMKYHTSWDWLMPVVEKIESIHDDFHGYFGVHISSNSCCIQGTKFDTRPGKEHYAYFNEVVHETKLTATHYAVYQFITWYNQQKQNDEVKEKADKGNS